MPPKIFSRMCDNQTYLAHAAASAKSTGEWDEYERLDSEQNSLMEKFNWPWSSSAQQTAEWNQHLRNIESYFDSPQLCAAEAQAKESEVSNA